MPQNIYSCETGRALIGTEKTDVAAIPEQHHNLKYWCTLPQQVGNFSTKALDHQPDQPASYAPIDFLPLTKPIMIIPLTSSDIPLLCIEIMTGK